MRALQSASGALAADRVRTRAALVAVALAMAVLVALTGLVGRSRAATLRALERAGLSNLWVARRADAHLAAGEAVRLARLLRATDVSLVRVAHARVGIGGRTVEAPVLGVAGHLAPLLSLKPRAGRLLADLEVEGRTPVVVLGAALAERLAPAASAAGRVATVGLRSARVVGTLEPVPAESAVAGDLPVFDWDQSALVPLGTEPAAGLEADPRAAIDLAVLAFASPAAAEDAASAARALDPARYGAGGRVTVTSPRETLRHYRQARRAYDALALFVGLLTAASAILGISNLLAASVLARGKEIGVRRAVGARARDVLLQLHAEGLLVALAGGGAGLAAGLAATILLGERGAGGTSPLALAGLGAACVVIGVAAGIAPARRAARIDPAAALRES